MTLSNFIAIPPLQFIYRVFICEIYEEPNDNTSYSPVSGHPDLDYPDLGEPELDNLDVQSTNSINNLYELITYNTNVDVEISE